MTHAEKATSTRKGNRCKQRRLFLPPKLGGAAFCNARERSMPITGRQPGGNLGAAEGQLLRATGKTEKSSGADISRVTPIVTTGL